MPHEYSFLALIGRTLATMETRRVNLAQEAQHVLSQQFRAAAEPFIGEQIERVAFDPLYVPDEEEVFELEKFELPKELIAAAQRTEEVPALTPDDITSGLIRAIVAIDLDGRGNVREAHFQAFDRRMIVEPRRTFLFTKDLLRTIDRPAITLPERVDASYRVGVLLIRSSAAVGRFMDISAFYRAATDADIGEVLEHDSLIGVDKDLAINLSTKWMRRRFAMAKDSGILDKVTPADLQRKAKDFGFKLETRKDGGKTRVVMPTEKGDLKNFLRLLNEEFFEGTLTRERYVTNSKRKVEA